MAEAFSNKVARAAGIVTSYSGSTVAAGSTAITVTALTGIGVSFLVDNQNFIAGTKVVQTLPVSGGVGTVQAVRLLGFLDQQQHIPLLHPRKVLSLVERLQITQTVQ